MRNGLRVTHGLHVTSKRLSGGGTRWYVYAWRGGPCIHTADGQKPRITPIILDTAAKARQEARSAPENTLARLVGDYKRSPEFSRLADSTARDYHRSIDRIVDRFGDAPLEVFDDWKMRGRILEWRDGWQGQPRTADKLVRTFGVILQWGIQRGHLRVNILSDIKALHESDRSEIIWEPHHWEALAPHASQQLIDALELCRMTGLRLGDLVKVERQHIMGQTIKFRTAKRRRVVVIPIFPELDELLSRLAPDGPLLRNSYGKPWTSSGLGGVFQKAKNKAGIDVHIHDLRGTYATWLCMKGLTDSEIGRVIGWAPDTIADLRVRYVDEARVVTSMLERLSV